MLRAPGVVCTADDLMFSGLERCVACVDAVCWVVRAESVCAEFRPNLSVSAQLHEMKLCQESTFSVKG